MRGFGMLVNATFTLSLDLNLELNIYITRICSESTGSLKAIQILMGT